MKWRSQLSEGRVFELRSKSKRYPAPCALILNAAARYDERAVAEVDRRGSLGSSLYRHAVNPAIYVDGLGIDDLVKRIRRRRRDLERFDADDLALIRYGLDLDFTGEIHGRYSDMHIPVIMPSEWTVFWLRAFEADDFRIYDWWHRPELTRLLRGAWYFNSHGGSWRLGYKFGHAWATRHTGTRLNQIRQFLRSHLPDIIEQQVKVVRWTDGRNIFTEEIRRECPALGGKYTSIESAGGTVGIIR